MTATTPAAPDTNQPATHVEVGNWPTGVAHIAVDGNRQAVSAQVSAPTCPARSATTPHRTGNRDRHRPRPGQTHRRRTSPRRATCSTSSGPTSS